MRFTIALVAFTFLTACEASAADAQHGQILARRWCQSCHLISSQQRTASTQVPPFSEIAKAKNFDAPKLAFFLLAPHPRMPDMNLSRSEAADLAAYIVMQER